MVPLSISAASTAASDADTMKCAHGYSGCIGVSMNGVQVALGRSHDLLDQWPVTVVLLDPFSWPAVASFATLAEALGAETALSPPCELPTSLGSRQP